jgi:hypothetical protein
VQLAILGKAGRTVAAHAIQISRHGMRLVIDSPIPVSAAVKVIGDDWLVLGEVSYCREERGHYAVGLHLDQALMGLKELDERRTPSRTSLPRLKETKQLSA